MRLFIINTNKENIFRSAGSLAELFVAGQNAVCLSVCVSGCWPG